mmetsp:Transcript_38618/g.85934  ORF Transcript_38618/g.85934 Transcript_38618/m.85934 type:complete len:189 (+) Transcript_38618:109-675(+)|eukprot:CAMPEP_0202892304 /NCGR_PEP_ID=MMETSP1392-20130828/2040_1 /ASSEMBLY_ACC=CAM_ASM_000868 /TAXON_ID=225041 /ORGANISM="Chlamydomonas chlamydogama, Strain SAG 11-48b" /LENGTH=188 /DNA_ID=CAMNT_0049576201 /DNA_START=86 /DNA_END=652 /DNA_ORIENTATION=+
MAEVNKLALAKIFLEAITTQKSDADESVNFDTTALSGLVVTSSERGRIVCKFPVTQKVSNRYGTLHGGCIATLVDTVSTAALVTVSDQTGVSVNLATTYLLPVPCGVEVVVDARVVRSGKTLATIQVDIKLPDGRVAATGMHTKFLSVGDPWWGSTSAAGGTAGQGQAGQAGQTSSAAGCVAAPRSRL